MGSGWARRGAALLRTERTWSPAAPGTSVGEGAVRPPTPLRLRRPRGWRSRAPPRPISASTGVGAEVRTGPAPLAGG
eukprot:6665828-Alexandrium_andersonii.AAC.1